MKASVYYQAKNILGEGPVWDHVKKEFLWVDIEGKKLQFLSDFQSEIDIHHFDQRIGFAAPAEHDQYMVGLEDGLYSFYRNSGKLEKLTSTILHEESVRFNDGKVDPFGNLWTGTMSINQELNKGSLYRLNANLEIEKIISPVSISNGLAWNPDLNKMYFIDSPTRRIQSFHYQEPLKLPLQAAFSFEIPEDLGYPDGMCIDVDGMLWVAHWDAFCIVRWHPETGQMITKIDIPAPRVTSCAFGGNDMSTLYITTARTGLDANLLEQYPLSGSIFTVDTNTKGLPPVSFKIIN